MGAGAAGGRDVRADQLAHVQATARVSALSGMVFSRDGVVWSGHTGDGSLRAQYRIGSITKTFVAVQVLRAREAGLLDLDDRLGDHLGDVGYRDATLRGMLSHTAGMQSEPVGPWWERNRGGTLAELLAANDGSGRVLQVGEGHYSNLGFGLLGAVLEHVDPRRRPWRVQVRDDLVVPLGLASTSYLPRPGAQPGWSVHPFTGVRVHEPLHDTGAMAPAGQLWSTVADLATWGQFLAGARPDLLPGGALAEMAAPVRPDYGLGLFRFPAPQGTLIGHTGSMPGFLAALVVDPTTGIGATVLANATTGFRPEQLALDLLEGATPDTEPGGPVEAWVPSREVPPEVRDVVGTWFWGNTGYVVRWHNERLEFLPLGRSRPEETFVRADGRWLGTDGYHRGETLHVRQQPDGALRLECATFVWTRQPYAD